MINKVFLFCVIGLFFSCKKDEPEESMITTVLSSDQGFLIGSEGNFQFGNSSLSYYDDQKKTISKGVFKKANGFELGDVLQSMYQLRDKLYLVVNNSEKIEIIDRFSFESSGTISGFVSPRYFLPVSNSKAYVSDLYTNSIHVVDLNTRTIISEIPTSGWTEEMTLIYGKAFVCNKEMNLIYVVDTSTDLVLDSIAVGPSPTCIKQDSKSRLWVLCEGASGDPNQESGLYRIDPKSYGVEQVFTNSEGKMSRLAVNGDHDTLYYLSTGAIKGVMRMAIEEQKLPTSAFIQLNKEVNVYGLGVNPHNGHLFVSDAIDYLQQSKIFHYDAQGLLLNSVNAGVNTSSFLFLK